MSRASIGTGRARVTLEAVMPGPPGVTGVPPPIPTAPPAFRALWMAERSLGEGAGAV